MRRACMVLLTGSLLLLPAGCATNSQSGGLIGGLGGAGAGAIIGQAIGHSTQATLLGTAIGAAIGGLAGTGVGYMMDRQEEEMRQALAASHAASVKREGEMLTLLFKSDLTFATNSAAVEPGLLPELGRVGKVMARYPDCEITVEGHTDSTGTDEYNQNLSERRAIGVRNLLVRNGVSASRITTMGFGKTQPVASNKTEAGRAKNRRVEIHIRPQA